MTRPDTLPSILTTGGTERLLDEPNTRYFDPQRDYLVKGGMLKADLRASEATSLRSEHVGPRSGTGDPPEEDHDQVEEASPPSKAVEEEALPGSSRQYRRTSWYARYPAPKTRRTVPAPSGRAWTAP